MLSFGQETISNMPSINTATLEQKYLGQQTTNTEISPLGRGSNMFHKSLGMPTIKTEAGASISVDITSFKPTPPTTTSGTEMQSHIVITLDTSNTPDSMAPVNNGFLLRI